MALSWKAATDNVGVDSYVVYRDGLPLTSMSSSVTSFTDTALVGNSAHQYYVKAFDGADNEGPASNTVTRSFADTTAPTAPSGLARTLLGVHGQAHLESVDGQRRSAELHDLPGGVAVGTSTTLAYTDSTPPPGKTSTCTVRARDAAGNLSAVSNSVTAAVPADTTPPTMPTSLRATAGTRQIVVAWNASTDNVGVPELLPHRANAKYRLLGKVTSFTDTGLVTGNKVHLQGLRDRRGGQLEQPCGEW